MTRLFIVLGALNAALAVILGASASHALAPELSPDAVAMFHKGVRYHFNHSLGLVLVGIVQGMTGRSAVVASAGWAMFLGIVLFSGSLYVLSITGIDFIRYVTPVGGTLFIVAWILLGIGALTRLDH